MCQNKVLRLEATYSAGRVLGEHRLFRLVPWDPKVRVTIAIFQWPPKDRGKPLQCHPVASVSIETSFQWQNFLNWEHTWQACFRNRAIGPNWVPWGRTPTLVVKGWAFWWAAWGPDQLPCTYGRPAQPQHPMRARTCTYSSGRGDRKGRHTPSSWPRPGRASGVLSQTCTTKRVSRPAESRWRVSGPSHISLVSWDMCFRVRPFHVMVNTTGWEKPQSTKRYRGPATYSCPL